MIVLVVVALTIGLVCILMRDKGQLELNTMRLSSQNNVVIIRDEISVYAERYSRIRFAVEEGSDVSNGDTLATAYKWGFSDDLTQSLISIRVQIFEAQNQLRSGVTDPELSALNLQIQQKQAQIREAVMFSGGQDVFTLEQELNTLLAQRSSYLKDLVQPNESLTSLYNSQTSKENQIADYAQVITATTDGKVSFYLDGYEQVLSAEKLNTINAALISSTVKNGSASTGTVDNLVCRIVNEDHWYIAFVTSTSSAWRLVEGESYTVVFDGYASDVFIGSALAPVISENGVLNILEFNQSIGELINLRTLSASIRLEATGLMLPLSAITVTDGIPGITIDGNTRYRVEVEVLAVNEDYAIIRSADESVTLYEGMRYVAGK